MGLSPSNSIRTRNPPTAPHTFSVLLAALLVAGCGGSGSPGEPRSKDLQPRCGAERVQRFEGRMLTEALRARIAAKSGAAAIRIMRPGHVYTMVYRPARLSIRIDKAGRITDLSCG